MVDCKDTRTANKPLRSSKFYNYGEGSSGWKSLLSLSHLRHDSDTMQHTQYNRCEIGSLTEGANGKAAFRIYANHPV